MIELSSRRTNFDNVFTLDDIANKFAREFIVGFSKSYGLFPGFYFVMRSPRNAWYQHWGEIVLIHDDALRGSKDLSAFTKYLLFLGIAYHALVPSTELNRLSILLALRKTWKNLPSNSEGFFISLFSLANNFYLVQKNYAWRNFVNQAFLDLISNLKLYSPIARFFVDLLLNILGFKKYKAKIFQKLISLIKSSLPLYLKARLFFETLKAHLGSLEPWTLHERNLRKFMVPLSHSDIMANVKQEPSLAPSDIEHLAEIDYNFAKSLAKTLDKLHSKGKTPAYSNRRYLHQKLLKERRYLASVRRLRIRKLVSLLETKLMNLTPTLERYGFSNWYLGDDVEKLDLEISTETYGHVIPNYTTLKDIYSQQGSVLGRRKFGHIELCIDTSGSMSGEPLDIAIEIAISLLYIAKRLSLSVGLVTFSSGAWEGLPPTRDYDVLEEILLRLDAEGGTNIRYALELLLSHVSSVNTNALVAFITDSHIYDINFPEVLSFLQNISSLSSAIFIIIGDKPWDKAMQSLFNVNIPIIIVDSNHTIIDHFDSLLASLMR